VFGPYVNRNHFAGFVELVAPVGLALLVFRGVRKDLFLMAGLLTIIPVGALILAGSRAGSFLSHLKWLCWHCSHAPERGCRAPLPSGLHSWSLLRSR
jgi:hypothetical protein